jgi:hypothetical protein
VAKKSPSKKQSQYEGLGRGWRKHTAAKFDLRAQRARSSSSALDFFYGRRGIRGSSSSVRAEEAASSERVPEGRRGQGRRACGSRLDNALRTEDAKKTGGTGGSQAGGAVKAGEKGAMRVGEKLEVEKDGLYYVCHISQIDLQNRRCVSACGRARFSCAGSPGSFLVCERRGDFPIDPPCTPHDSESTRALAHNTNSRTLQAADRIPMGEQPSAGRII